MNSSRPLRVVAFAILASLLLVTAMPATVAAQSEALVVGSQHTTDADFQNAETLTNLDVADGAISTPGVETTTNTSEETDELATGDIDGDGDDEIAFRNTGDNSLKIHDPSDGTTSDTGESTYELEAGDIDGDGDDEIAFRNRSDNSLKIHDPSDGTTSDTGESTFQFATGDIDGDGDDEIAFRNTSDNSLKIHDPSDGTTSDTGESTNRVVTGDTNGDGDAEIVFEGSSSGSLLIHDPSDGSTTDTGGQTFRITTGDTDDDGADEIAFQSQDNSFPLKIYDAGTGNITDTGEVTIYLAAGDTDGDGDAEIAFRDSNTGFLKIHNPGMSAGDESEYISATHNVNNVSEAVVNITAATDVEIGITVEYHDGNGWQTAESTTVTTTANHSIAISDVAASEWRLQVDVTATGGSPQFTLSDESILFVDQAPALSNPQPADGAGVAETSTELSIDVNDSQFGSAQGEQVDVTFYDASDDSVIGTDSLSSNGTATTTWDNLLGGANEWYVVAEDSYGQTTTSSTFTVNAPSEVTFRNEQDPDQVLTNVQVNVTAYYSDEAVRRTVSDGTLNLSGFPVGEPIVIRASGENYTTRTAVIESISEQSSVYLLNESVPTYQVRFDLQDPTGEYPRSDTVLFVERDLTLNGSTEWRTITGDNFGVRGVSATIEQGERYRLRVRNLETGATATIGAYTPVQSETVTVSPGSATIDVTDSEKAYDWSTTENESGQYILFEYLDSEGQTSSVTLTIHERFNKSNVVVDNETFTETNDLVYKAPLTANQTNQTWMAEIYIDRGGETLHFREPVTGPTTSIIPANLDPMWLSAIGVFVLLITAMMFSQLNRTSGALGTALVGGMLWQIGLLSTVATGPAIVLSIGISLVAHYRGDGGGF